MDAYLIPLDEIRLDDAERVGRKAAGLGALKAAGFQVPDGLCLVTDAFALALRLYIPALREALSGLETGGLESAEHTAGQIEDVLRDLEIPDEVLEGLDRILEFFGADTPLAVRSSAVNEDLPGSSFAGQYKSVIGARGPRALQFAVLECWKSYYRAGAVMERARQGLPDEFGMALLIQPVLQAACSGVCFSLSPVDPESQQVMVNAAWGLGSGIVDGTVAGDTWRLDRLHQMVVERQVAHKTQQVGLDPGGGLTLLPVPAERQDAACLPDAWLQRTAQLALTAEALRGCPQDVEWAIVDQALWLLQSRPIASLRPEACETGSFPVAWENKEDRCRLWHVYRPTSSIDGLILPLERDDLRLVEEMRADTCRLLGADRNLRWMEVNGRMYSTPAPVGLSAADMRLRRTAQDDLYSRLHAQNLTSWDYYGPEIVTAVQRLAAFQPHDGGVEALAVHLEDAIAARRRHYMIHPMIRFRPGRAYFEAFEALSGLTGRTAEAAAYQLIENDGSILTRMMDAIYALAVAGRSTAGLPKLIADPPPDALEQIAMIDGSGHFLALLRDFLERYGARNGDGYGSEGTLATPTWRERPQEVLRLAAPYLDPALPSPAERRKKARMDRDLRLEALCRPAGPRAVKNFRGQLAYAERLSIGLEEHNHYIDQMAYGQLRLAVLLAADWLVEQGSLDAAADIFWLTFDEILMGLRAQSAADFHDTVAVRKNEHAGWTALSAPPILGLPDFHLPARPSQPVQSEAEPAVAAGPEQYLIRGLGASAGKVRGRVRLVLEAGKVPSVSPGDVLVAVNAGPLWSPIFSLLGALVLDGGSLAQHAASTAREYGIPAVIAAQDATRRLSDGVWVTVDGSQGIVEIVSP